MSVDQFYGKTLEMTDVAGRWERSQRSKDTADPFWHHVESGRLKCACGVDSGFDIVIPPQEYECRATCRNCGKSHVVYDG